MAGGDDNILWAAIRAVKAGVSANKGLQAARAAGLKIQRQTWLRMVGEVRTQLASQIDEVSKPLNSVPSEHEIKTYSHTTATGHMQYIDVFVKDRVTGLVKIRPYAVRTQKLMTRGEVIKTGLNAFRDAIDDDPENYPETVLGAVYTATYRFGGEK